MRLFNGTEYLEKQKSYTAGPWGENGEEILYPTSKITPEMWDDIGYLPCVRADVPDGQRAVGWASPVLEDGRYIRHPLALEPVSNRVIDRDEFIDRFTIPEQQAILAAALTDLEVTAIYTEFLAAPPINLDNPDTIQAVNALVEKGILADGRQTEILAPA